MFGVDVSTITKNYLLKTAQLQGEIDAKTNLYNTNKALFDLLYPKSSSSTINLIPPP